MQRQGRQRIRAGEHTGPECENLTGSRETSTTVRSDKVLDFPERAVVSVPYGRTARTVMISLKSRPSTCQV
jgi:hypothetical protein